jgi:hypothetical protein
MSSSETGDLHALIENAAHMEVELVTVACAGGCADVEAVARGGHPPYTFKWTDGSVAAKRQLCADTSGEFTVNVTDTDIVGELHYDAQTVQASVTFEVASSHCGMPDGAESIGPCDSVADGFVATGSGANPQGAWSFGWSASLGSAFTLYSFYYPFTPASQGAFVGAGFPEAAQWFDKSQGFVDVSTGYAVPPIPEVQFNPTSAPSHPAAGNLATFAGSHWTLLPGEFALAPGATQYSIARWTAASAGSFVVQANFRGACGDTGGPQTSADVHVRHSDTELGAAELNSNGTGNSFAITKQVTVAAGDSIDFSVGSAGGVFVCPDVTLVDARVCTTVMTMP